MIQRTYFRMKSPVTLPEEYRFLYCVVSIIVSLTVFPTIVSLTPPICHFIYFLGLLYEQVWLDLTISLQWRKMVRHALKILQHLLQDFQSVSDHFTTLRSKIPVQFHWPCSGVFVINFEQISYIVLVFLLLTLNK